MPGYKTTGIVLRTRPLGEADLVVTLFTDKEGKVEAAARGAKRGRSRLLGCAQIFTYGEYLLWPGRSLDRLSQGEIIHSFRELREELPRMAAASYITEVADLFTPQREANSSLLVLLLEALRFTAETPENSQLRTGLHVFELRLLSILGYAPHLGRCVNCGGVEGDSWRFSFNLGGLLCPACLDRDPEALPVSAGVVETLRHLSVVPWAQVSRLRMTSAVEHGVRQVLQGHIRYRLEQEPNSGRFLDILEV